MAIETGPETVLSPPLSLACLVSVKSQGAPISQVLAMTLKEWDAGDRTMLPATV